MRDADRRTAIAVGLALAFLLAGCGASAEREAADRERIQSMLEEHIRRRGL